MGSPKTRESKSGGVPVFSIGGRMVQLRERLQGMTDEERQWRAQYLKDHFLAEDEPKFCPELFRATNNIFRRMAAMPLDLITGSVAPVIGAKNISGFRYVLGRVLIGLTGIYMLTYYLKYNSQDWTRDRGVNIHIIPPPLLPGDPGYPTAYKKEPYEYADEGFSKSIFSARNGK